MTVLKRPSAPTFWPIERKTKKFAVPPQPGPHAKKRCIPIGIIVRDVLGYARTLNEVREVLKKRMIKVDGRVRNEPGFPVGLMDVFTIGSEHHRILPDKKGLKVIPVKDNEKIKLCRIENKKNVAKKIQLNLHDGKNILIDKDSYKTGDTLIIDIEKNKIKDSIKMKKGSIGLIISGKNAGNVGKISEIIITRSSQPNKIVMKIADKSYEVPKDYVFAIGADKPAINLGE